MRICDFRFAICDFRSGGNKRLAPGYLALLSVIGLIGCAAHSNDAVRTASGQTSLSQKLAAMPADQRVEYVKTHMDEVRADVGLHGPLTKKP